MAKISKTISFSNSVLNAMQGNQTKVFKPFHRTRTNYITACRTKYFGNFQFN